MPYMTADDACRSTQSQGQREPDLLIHGWTMNHKFFRRLSPTITATSMDIRGHGHSGKRELNMSRRMAARTPGAHQTPRPG